MRSCSSCGRPGGAAARRCIYCGAELPPVEAVVAAEDALEPQRARDLLRSLSASARAMMPPVVLARLEAAAQAAPPSSPAPVVRSSLGFTGLGRRGTTSATLPPVRGPTPPPLEDITSGGAGSAGDDPSIDELPAGRLQGLPPAPLAADLPEDPPPAPLAADLPEELPTVGRMRAVEDESLAALSTSAIRPLDTGEMEALPLDALMSFDELEPVDAPEVPLVQPAGGPLTTALLRGGGPFGPRDTEFRLILLPDESYRSQVHWLRHRLADTTGIDLYTAAQILSRDVPAYLFGSDRRAAVEERAAHLRGGGLEVLVLGRGPRSQDIEPILVLRASGERPGPVCFKTDDGATIEVKRVGLAWACLGEIEPDGERSGGVRERTFRGRTVPERPVLDTRGGAYLLLDLFLTRAAQPVRLRADRFDFSCLGVERELSASLNLRKMLQWLSPEPGAPLPLDESFKRLPHLRVGGSKEQWDGEQVVPQREVEFTEYGLILNAQRRGATFF